MLGVQVQFLWLAALPSAAEAFGGGGVKYDDVAGLKQHIFAGYDGEQWPPGPETGTGVVVAIGLNIERVAEIDVTNGYLELDCWLRLEWTDSRLNWENTEWQDIAYIEVDGARPRPSGPQYASWVPDVELYNGAESTYVAAPRSGRAMSGFMERG